MRLFQPFLRFWNVELVRRWTQHSSYVSTLLEILAAVQELIEMMHTLVSTLLEIPGVWIRWAERRTVTLFQPFLRFWGSYNWLLWFLSFSLVFCLLGSRLETTLYIHFTRRWVISRRHSSAPCENERRRRGGKERHSSQLAVL